MLEMLEALEALETCRDAWSCGNGAERERRRDVGPNREPLPSPLTRQDVDAFETSAERSRCERKGSGA
ncbi:MAG: hypothetical protein IJZ10_01710 [Thermoguttaceae bacterium]|nr:hypothetical protein [Thermoguttaceae bacterium]